MKQKRVELTVKGMTCEHCAQRVEQALTSVPGVLEAQVHGWQSGRATVVLGPETPVQALEKAVADAGYHAEAAAQEPLEEPSEASTPILTVRPGEREVDLAILGGGSAAFAAAIRAAELGYSVLMVEQGVLGGTCVNVGCIPSKTLLRSAEAYHAATRPRFLGVHSRGADLDWAAIMAEKDELVRRLRKKRYEDVLAAYPSIRLVQGRGRLTPEGHVKVDGRVVEAARVVVATGASPHVPSFPGIERADVLTSTEALSLTQRPDSLLILGGRFVALELAQIYARFGTRVTVLQRSSRIIPAHEPEIAEALAGYLQEEGITIHTGVQIRRLGQETGQAVVHALVEGAEREFRAERLLAATGRRPNTADMGLEQAGIALDERGAVRVDDTLRTTNPRVYAAGDVTGEPMLVYLAAAEGALAAENALLGGNTSRDRSVIPQVIFTDPQVATVGLTEREAVEQGLEVETALLPLEYVPRALAARDTRGLVKLVAEAGTGRLLGAHVLAAEGGEVIQTAAVALRARWRVQDLVATLFPYLTQVEALRLAALAFSKDVDKLSCCAA